MQPLSDFLSIPYIADLYTLLCDPMHCTDFTVRPLSTAQMILYPLHRRSSVNCTDGHLSTVHWPPDYSWQDRPTSRQPRNWEGKRGMPPWRCLWRGSARFACRALVRESAVECFGEASGGDERALPTVRAGWKRWNLSRNAAFSNKISFRNRASRTLGGGKSKISIYFFVTRISLRNFAS